MSGAPPILPDPRPALGDSLPPARGGGPGAGGGFDEVLARQGPNGPDPADDTGPPGDSAAPAAPDPGTRQAEQDPPSPPGASQSRGGDSGRSGNGPPPAGKDRPPATDPAPPPGRSAAEQARPPGPIVLPAPVVPIPAAPGPAAQHTGQPPGRAGPPVSAHLDPTLARLVADGAGPVPSPEPGRAAGGLLAAGRLARDPGVLPGQAPVQQHGAQTAAAVVGTLYQAPGGPPPTAGGADGLPSVPVAVGQPDWDRGLGERLVWLARHGIQEARVRLNPPQLGPLEVRISVQHDQASVHFASHHALVRDALDAALPRLRDVLGEQGLNLAQVDISRHGFGQGGDARGDADGPARHGRGSWAGLDPAEGPVAGAVTRSGLRLLDVYV